MYDCPRFLNVAASTFLMSVQLSASQSMEFQIVLPRDTVDSVSAEFQHAFPQISACNRSVRSSSSIPGAWGGSSTTGKSGVDSVFLAAP